MHLTEKREKKPPAILILCDEIDLFVVYMQWIMYFAQIPRILMLFFERGYQNLRSVIIILMMLSCVIDRRVIKEFL